MEITSLTNAKVKQWAKYKEKKYRESDHRFLIEGEHLIQEAQQAGIIECIILEQGREHPFSHYETYEVTTDIMKKLSDSVSGTWIMAVCRMQEQCTSFGNKVIVLDGVQDPGNVGTIIRSALSFGYTSIVLSRQCADVYNEKLIRSTQGAVFHIPVIRGDILELLQEIKAQGIYVYATSLHHASPLQNITVHKPCALVFGNEGQGISDAVIRMSDEQILIEMETFESLNVAVAAGICMYEFR